MTKAKHYFGAKCDRCGGETRYISNGACANCQRDKNRAAYYARRGDTEQAEKAFEGYGRREMEVVVAADGGKVARCPIWAMLEGRMERRWA